VAILVGISPGRSAAQTATVPAAVRHDNAVDGEMIALLNGPMEPEAA
jgi:hypothetical protein